MAFQLSYQSSVELFDKLLINSKSIFHAKCHGIAFIDSAAGKGLLLLLSIMLLADRVLAVLN